jgi:UDP:flavonoid glycosyltransferase YjiC (YdhE family)
MARFLVATHPITGHVLPALPIATELASRGHEVRWYAGEKFRARVEAAGAGFEPYVEAYDFDDTDYDAAFPGHGKLSGLRQITFDFVKIFAEQVGPQHRDLARVVRRFPADVVLGDTAMIAAVTLGETGGPPSAVFNITCLGLKGRDVAPFGLGLLPSGSLLGRARNRALEFLAPNVVFRSVSRALADQYRSVGARPRKFEGPLVSPFLYLQPSVPSFEYPRSDLPPQVHFVGALLPATPADLPLPAWWPELTSGRPVVLVTQGTVATNVRDLIGPAIQGLAGEDLLVVAAGVRNTSDLGLTRLPANARVEPFVPFARILPHVSAFVTNGGYGGVQHALSAGVPVVIAGNTEDKPEVANRVAFSGAGINLRTNRPSAGHVRTAVRSVLDQPGYRSRAGLIQADLQRLDGPALSADLLERLTATGRPVHRS